MNAEKILKQIQSDIKQSFSNFKGEKIDRDLKTGFKMQTLRYLNNIGMNEHITAEVDSEKSTVIINLIPLDDIGKEIIKKIMPL